MISPEGLAIKPRIPASWRICCLEPLAPESAMIRIGFISPDSCSRRFISVNIPSATRSVTSDEIRIPLFDGSPWLLYHRLYPFTPLTPPAFALHTSSPLAARLCHATHPIESPP